MSHSDSPYFLLGAVRSGTTLLRLMLGHHPAICLCEEFDFSVETLEVWREGRDLSRYYDAVEMHRGFRESGYTLRRGVTPEEFIRGCLDERRRADGKDVVGATVHSKFSDLLGLWPDARFIYLRRDPRDVARSIIGMGWAGNTWHACGRWVQAEREWQEMKSALPADRRLELSFEQLVEDAEGCLERICAFLGVPYSPEMLELERDTTYKRPRRGGAASWTKTASPAEVRLAEARAGELLARAGYGHSEHPPLRVGPLRRTWLTIQDRIFRIRFAIGRYGLRLWGAGVVSRRLPLTGWRRQVELRIHDVMRQHVQ